MDSNTTHKCDKNFKVLSESGLVLIEYKEISVEHLDKDIYNIFCAKSNFIAKIHAGRNMLVVITTVI